MATSPSAIDIHGATTVATLDTDTIDNSSPIAIDAFVASLNIENSTFRNNGTGLVWDEGDDSITNSTFDGGGQAVSVDPDDSSTMRIIGSTITGEIDGLNVLEDTTLGGDIIAGNGTDCRVGLADPVDLGGNIDGDGTCGLTQASDISDSPTIADSLKPIGNNGGPTETVGLAENSPAIGLIQGSLADGTAICGTPDQRGVTRPVAECDAGAMEPAPTVTPDFALATAPSGGRTVGDAVTFGATVVGNSIKVPSGTVTFTADGNSLGSSCTDTPLFFHAGVEGASCQASRPVGTYQLRARYNGDATYTSARDTIASYAVNPVVTTTSASAATKAKAGKKVTVTAITKHKTGPGHPTGKVTARIKLTKGRNYIQAVYSGERTTGQAPAQRSSPAPDPAS